MGHAAIAVPLTIEQFLEWDASQSLRHEFVSGEVFAMAGADDRHVTVAGNLYIALRAHLGGTPCRAYMSDMKLAVKAADSVFYPDVMVCCSEADRVSPLVKSEPRLLIEVLSPSTAAFDRGGKFAAYRQLPSLEEFVLVDLDSRRCDVYRLGSDGLWVLHPVAPGEDMLLASVQLTLTAAKLFADVVDDR